MRAPSFLYSGQMGKTSNYLGSHLREVLQIKFKKKKIRKGRGGREAMAASAALCGPHAPP
jgi:hypothetical protein